MSLRILMTADTIGGVWTYCLDLCRAVQGHGVEFLLATMGDPPSSLQRTQAAELPNVRLVSSTWKLEWMDDPWRDVELAGRWLQSLADDYSPDVVHLSSYAHGALNWNAPVLVVAHSCVISWWHAVKGTPPPPMWNPYRHAVTQGLQRASLIVAPTQAMLSSIARHYPDAFGRGDDALDRSGNACDNIARGARARDIAVCDAGTCDSTVCDACTRASRAGDVGVSNTAGHAMSDQRGRSACQAGDIDAGCDALRRARVIFNGRDPSLYGPQAKQPFILSAGRLWDEAKNLGVLCDIASEIPWPIRVAGPTTSPDGRTVSARGLALLGALPPAALAREFACAAIYALPARYEPFGLSALEAAMSGCALVLGDIPSLREVWADSAVYVDPRSPADCRDALRDLIAHPIRRQSLADRARERARRYTTDAMGLAYLSAYRQLAARRPAMPRTASPAGPALTHTPATRLTILS